MSGTFFSGNFGARLIWKLRCELFQAGIRSLRRFYFRGLGLQVGRDSGLPSIHVTWPHQVRIGSGCRIEHAVYFHFDGVYSEGPSIRIGNDCFIGAHCEFNIRKGISVGDGSLIAAGSRFVDHDHGLKDGGGFCPAPESEREIVLGKRVWVGANAVILKGVQIGNDAVVAAGAVVTKDVGAMSIVAGVPARVVGTRK
ncbi:MAG: DapH/DapD/GlmU-related protein [Verrucomicrobiota bacterium]